MGAIAALNKLRSGDQLARRQSVKLPVQITFRDIETSPAIETRIREQVARLAKFHDRITGCRVIVEAHHRRHRKGKLYHVRIDLTVPGAELVVSRDPERDQAHEDVYVAIRDAFDSARRQLQDRTRQARGAVKAHEGPPHGRVVRLDLADDCGFIETPDGRQVYFHRNSVLDGCFDDLVPGAEVWFAEELGDRGPQATTVHIVGKHHRPPTTA
jgi:ribosomal subunit interface protein